MKSYPVFEISKIEIKSEECAQGISSCFICFTQQMKVIINCGKSDILNSKQVVSLAKRISYKFFQCLQYSPPASTRSLQLSFVYFLQRTRYSRHARRMYWMALGWLNRYLCLRPIRLKLLWTTNPIAACILADVVWTLLRKHGGETIIIQFGGVSRGIMMTRIESMKKISVLKKRCFLRRISTLSTEEIPTEITETNENVTVNKHSPSAI